MQPLPLCSGEKGGGRQSLLKFRSLTSLTRVLFLRKPPAAMLRVYGHEETAADLLAVLCCCMLALENSQQFFADFVNTLHDAFTLLGAGSLDAVSIV